MAYASENLSELWIISPGFDDLLVNGDTTDADGNTYTIDATDDGASWDSPVPVDVAVQRWMTDGAVAATQGHENRTPTFQVRITADTSSALAAAEAALVKRSAQPCLLKWVPPEGAPDAPATVFEVWTWHLSHTFNGTDERHLQRYYTLTFTAKPWARSENLTTAVAPVPPGAPTTVLVDSCTTATGWSGAPNAPTVVGGTSVKEAAATTGGAGSIVTLQLTRSGTVTGITSTPYLQIDATTAGGLQAWFDVSLDGIYLPKVAQIGTVSYWQIPAGWTQFSSLAVFAGIQATHGTGGCSLTVSDVSRTDTVGGIGSRKQLTRHLAVGGSVKTSGSLHLSAATPTPLGNVLVYTRPDDGSGYTPPLRQFRVSGPTVTPDSTMVSGSREPFVTAGVGAGSVAYSIPAQVLPDATYVVAARVMSSAISQMTVTFTSHLVPSGEFQSFTTTVPVTAAGGGSWAILGVVHLPPVAMPSESQQPISITMSAPSATASATITLDEVYLLDVTHGDFSLVAMPLGYSAHLWLDAADADPNRNRQSVYAGLTADRSDAFTPNGSAITAIGDHDLDPNGAMVFTVTDAYNDAIVAASFYRRWHTHAGD